MTKGISFGKLIGIYLLYFVLYVFEIIDYILENN